MFTYQTVRNMLLAVGNGSGTMPAVSDRLTVNPPHWYLVSLVDSELLLTDVYSRGKVILGVLLAALLLLVLLSRAWGVRVARNAYAAERIRAYASVIEQSNELIYVVSQAGEILFANPAVERCYGYSQDEMIGKRPSVFKSGRHPEEFYKLLWQTICAGEVFEGVFVNKRKDGTLFYEAKRIVPLCLEESGETVFVSMGRDLTAMSEKKHQDLRSTSRLSTSMQHHFNNLLNGIMGYLQLAIDQIDHSDVDKARDMLARSLESAMRAEELVSRIAKSGSIGHGQLDSMDPVKLAGRVAQALQVHMPEGVVLSLSTADGLPQIQGDAKLLESALQALIENAVDAVTGEGHVRVTLDVMTPLDEVCVNCNEPINGDQLVIAVSDDGTGIGEDHLKEIFDPFFTTKASAKLVASTPGLGLTIVRSIAHIHDGHVLLDTREGVGTTVRLLLPLKSGN